MKIHSVYFSPKGGTKGCADALAEGFSQDITVTDITLPESRENVCEIKDCETVLFASPVFGGHAQAFFREYIENLKGNGNPCILMAVYGNRDYDMAIREMADIVISNGFRVAACVSAVSEHSFNNDIRTGRPDADDRAALKKFGKEICEKISSREYGVFTAEEVPQKPLNMAVIGMHGPKIRGLNPGHPVISADCIRCNACAENCPAGAIDFSRPEIFSQGCIRCRECARICPVKAIEFTQEDFRIVADDCMKNFGKDVNFPEIWTKNAYSVDNAHR